MLSEPECRVLSSAFDILLMDFDPKDAVLFLESAGFLTEDLAERIAVKPTRLERLRELLRIYRRRAEDCKLLISYFEFAGQEHIADSLRTDLDHVLDGFCSSGAMPRFPEHLRLRKLLAGGVPRVWQHVKRERLQSEVADMLRERADLGSVARYQSERLRWGGELRGSSSSHTERTLISIIADDNTVVTEMTPPFLLQWGHVRGSEDSFIVVLHGIAGCGKSSLAAAVLADVPDLLGNCFESTVWLRDSRTEAHYVRYLFADLLLMLWDDETSDPPKLGDLSSVHLRKHIQAALVDKPNVLIVLDDVVQIETVKWASDLGLRVLATSRNAELFSSASCSVDIIHVDGFTSEESVKFFSVDSVLQGDEKTVHLAMDSALSVGSGNAALLTMLKKQACGRADRLATFSRRLMDRGLSSLSATTSYEYDSMHSALTVSVERLPQCDRDTLACGAILPSEEDIPLAVWALFVPVDVTGFSDDDEFSMLLSDRLCRLCNNGGWFSHNARMDSFRFSKMVEIYLRETVEAESIKALVSILKMRLEKCQRGDYDNHSVMEFFLKHASYYKSVHGIDVRDSLLDAAGSLMVSSTPGVRFAATILVACTLAMAQLLISIPLHDQVTMVNPLQWLVIVYIIVCYQWNRLYGASLTRKQRALFDEWNILQTYQPRAWTMGHLFQPEPPTPFPEDSSGSTDPFKAQRDAHYANEYTYVLKLAAERKDMESMGIHEKPPPQADPKTEVMRVELKPDKEDDQSSLREI